MSLPSSESNRDQMAEEVSFSELCMLHYWENSSKVHISFNIFGFVLGCQAIKINIVFFISLVAQQKL